MKIYYIISIIIIFFINNCSTIRESAGVNRKNVDEFSVIENPPLIIPPDFNLLPPDQLEEKNINNIEKDLAKEILFGIEEVSTASVNQTSTMNQILIETKAIETSPDIRNEIDENFSQEINTNSIFKVDFENQIEVLDAIQESERLRNNNFEGKPIAEGAVPIKVETIKKKKKKRFIFF